ncbi:unnamed protein product [Rotaria sordida]|uniref:F-box domain-containing protein n=1 Tax=Rotaria sordida TaxID=392033 RepID=A0A819CXF1_9BILA|nr:unnamed protein product [Rotaria sordida]CAF3826294.1 unnamed protein product [Rotaria sordida]
MNFESLANELILDLFEYLSFCDLIHGFNSLNCRIDNILFDYFHIHGVDLRSISKREFNIICRHLSSISNKINSLSLSENDDTPGEIYQFYYNGFTLRQFVYLQRLSLYNIYSEDIIKRIVLDLSYLNNINYLKFDECCFTYDEKNLLELINIIWNLPKLTYCKIKMQINPQMYFPIPEFISLTIEHLSLSNIEPRFNQMNYLFEKTPSLRYVSIDFHLNISHQYKLSSMTSITTLNLSFFSIEYKILSNLFVSTPNLYRLKIDLPDMFIDGIKWQKIIENNLSKLKIFQFRMIDEIDNDYDKEEQINQILNSFRSQFWINNHQWFVQCDSNRDSNYILVYNLPYSFNNYYFQYPIQSKSTYPFNDYKYSYNYVHRLTYKSNLSQYTIQSNIKFIKIRDLCIYIPTDDYLSTIIPTFQRLKLIEILSNGNENQYYLIQFERLIDQIPHLTLIRIHNCSLTILETLSIRNKFHSLSQIDLMSYNKWYNNDECLILSRSLLYIKCKLLLIDVTNRTCIFQLVNTINNIQSINVRSKDDQFNNKSTLNNDELVCWLRQCLPFSCFINRNYYPISSIRLWIR